MALETFNCLNCGSSFEAGDWSCKSGEQHVVDPVEFYILDAPHDHNDRIHSRNLICNVIPEQKRTVGNDVYVTPGVHVEFVRGRYQTSDPQIQMRLKARKNIFHGEEGRKLWEGNYLTSEEKTGQEMMRLRSEVARLEQEQSALLIKVRDQKMAESRKTA